MTAKVRISNWISEEAKEHLSNKSKEKNISESHLLEIAIKKIK